MIMEGSTATKLKVRRVDGCPWPGSSRNFLGEVDVLATHRIQEHTYTTGTLDRVVDEQGHRRREYPKGGTVIPIKWYGEIGPNGGLVWRSPTWNWMFANDAPARTPTVTVTR